MTLERALGPYNHQEALDYLEIAEGGSLRLVTFIQLSRAPNVLFLRQLINLPNEVNIFFYNNQWFANRGRGDMAPAWSPKESTIRLHSHRLIGGKKEEWVEFPHQTDLFSSSTTGKNCIISSKGLTIFTHQTGQPFCSEDFSGEELKEIPRQMQLAELEEESREAREEASKEKYEEFLRNMGVDCELIPWEDLTDERLREIWD